jgi:hypothetical protein
MAKKNLVIATMDGREIDLEKFNSFRDIAPGIKIKKALIKDGLFLNVEYNEKTASGNNKVKKDCTPPIHDDLKAEFAKLDEHLATICEQFDSVGNIDVDNTSCKGFAIGGEGESEGVTLIGTRKMDDGKVVNLVSPFTNYGDDYGSISELSKIVDGCVSETKQYLFEGKFRPDNQGSLFEDELNDMAEEEL